MAISIEHSDVINIGAQLREKHASGISLRMLLGAALPPKLPPMLLTMVGLLPTVKINELSDKALEKLFTLLTALPFRVTGVRGFEFCQVSAGGVPVSEVNPLSMSSRILPNLLLAGETLDVVGPCGGYNLHFAFAPGRLRGWGPTSKLSWLCQNFPKKQVGLT